MPNGEEILKYPADEISAHHLVVMADSCYFAIAAKGTTNLDNEKKTTNYNKLLERRARIVLASGSKERVEDTNQKHSAFGLSFIQSLKNNNNIIRLREITENIFVAHYGSRQQPYHARVLSWHDGGGDFLFISKK